jgi:hypothetical protein
MIITMQHHDPAVSCTSFLTPHPVSLPFFPTSTLTYLFLSSSVVFFIVLRYFVVKLGHVCHGGRVG